MSFGIKIRATTLRFEQKRFAKEADKQLEALFHGAARAFLIATVRRIPVRTGFLRGAFTTLEDVIGSFAFKQARKAGTFTGKAPRASKAKLAKLPPKRLEKIQKRIARLRKEIARRRKTSTAAQIALDRQTLFHKMRGNLPLHVARVQHGGIRGRNLQKGFRLHHGERITDIFRLIEYYYPNVGSKRKVLKTPRSGRPFATQPPLIITRQDSRVTTSASSGRWVFKYSVDIRYLAINDTRLGWASWESGILAFNQYIAANFAPMFPDVAQFFIKEDVSRTTSGNLARR